jgi:hypothetical protein
VRKRDWQDGRTALLEACLLGQLSVVEWLIEQQACDLYDVDKVRSSSGPLENGTFNLKL